MLQGIVIWLITLMLSIALISTVSKSFKGINTKFLTGLFFYHTALALAYYIYALYNPSDSKNYYATVLLNKGGTAWFDYFGNSTSFIEFLTFPLVNFFGLSYESCMAIYAFLGYIGFVFFYIFFHERIFTRPKIFGFDGTTFIFLLPNLHFWSSSIGKGSIMFFAFGLFFFALKNPIGRIIPFVIGGYVMYMVRGHILFVVLIAMTVGYTFSTKGASILVRAGVLIAALGILVYIYNDILVMTGLDDESAFDPLISHRATELAKATSGIDITNYSLPEKLFAFCFRPLFFDAPGMLGLIVSFENLFYLGFFLNMLRPKFIEYLIASDAIVKACFLTFLGVSIALAQITGNLGLAMRQKSQVMILLMFVILKLFDEERISQLKKIDLRKRLKERLAKKAMALEGIS